MGCLQRACNEIVMPWLALDDKLAPGAWCAQAQRKGPA